MVRMPTEDEPAVVICGDAMEVLLAFPDGSVDHLISDPPYAEKTHAGARTDRPSAGPGIKKLVTFDSISDDYFLDLCEESVRVAKRWVLMTCDWRHAAVAEKTLPKTVIRLGVWVKPNPAPQFTGDRPGTGWEAVLLLHREGKKRWNGGGRSANWINNVERDQVHPTQKPLALVRKWVRDFTDPGDVILDPFMGSGTTLLAALLEGRFAIGVEREEKYCEMARKRLAGIVPLTSKLSSRDDPPLVAFKPSPKRGQSSQPT